MVIFPFSPGSLFFPSRLTSASAALVTASPLRLSRKRCRDPRRAPSHSSTTASTSTPCSMSTNFCPGLYDADAVRLALSGRGSIVSLMSAASLSRRILHVSSGLMSTTVTNPDAIFSRAPTEQLYAIHGASTSKGVAFDPRSALDRVYTAIRIFSPAETSCTRQGSH